MDRESVSSSNLRSVGYDPTTRTMEVEFRNGSIYEYDDVPEHVYRDLMQASSKGSYFHESIRSSYRYRQLK